MNAGIKGVARDGPPAAAADPVDVLRLHPRGRPPGRRLGGRGRNAAEPGDDSLRRNARGHLYGTLLHAVVLRRDPRPGVPRQAEGGRPMSSRGGNRFIALPPPMPRAPSAVGAGLRACPRGASAPRLRRRQGRDAVASRAGTGACPYVFRCCRLSSPSRPAPWVPTTCRQFRKRPLTSPAPTTALSPRPRTPWPWRPPRPARPSSRSMRPSAEDGGKAHSLELDC